ncbi:MAG: hypothetical protein WC756_04910 [Taibaiella sp.]|jgi:hypothetical protein
MEISKNLKDDFESKIKKIAKKSSVGQVTHSKVTWKDNIPNVNGILENDLKKNSELKREYKKIWSDFETAKQKEIEEQKKIQDISEK